MAETAASYSSASWLVKSEPFKYSWAQLCRDGRTRWDGVRNFEARNNLRAMRVGDRLLFYHSNEGKQIVGLAEVVAAAYPDPTAPGEDWSVVDVAPVATLAQPVPLSTIKAEPRLAELALLRKSRLSVVPVTAGEFALLMQMGGGTTAVARPPARRPARPRATPKTTKTTAPPKAPTSPTRRDKATAKATSKATSKARPAARVVTKGKRS
jgi:predicted RNA-binding protein with PUA-like domain